MLSEKNEYWSETFAGKDFSSQVIKGKEFDGCVFRDCDFSEATFERCNFVDCEFNQCNLSVVSLAYSKFSDVVFHESKLVGVDWTRITRPSLIVSSPVNFYKCILNDSSFFGLSFPELILEECKAHQVDFREGFFSSASFTYSDFSGSQFSQTDLAEADFSEASNYSIDVYQNRIKGAKFSRHEAVGLLESLEIELVD